MYRNDSCLMRDVLSGNDDEWIRKNLYVKALEQERKRLYAEELQRQMTEKQRKEGEYSLKYHQRQQKSLSTTGSMEEKGFSPKTQKCLVQEWVEKDYLDSFLANQTSLDRNQSFKKLLTEQGSFRSERLEESNGQDIFSGFSKDDKSGRSKENTIRLNFRTDNAFITVAEQETKQENAKQLRENLLKQIEEKKRNQELSKRQEREQEMHDQRRVVREVQAMNDKHEMQTQEEKEKEQRAKLKQDSVAEAWSQAKSESMKRKASINRRVVDSIPVDQDRSTNTTMEAVNMEAEIKKLQAIITQERLTMQHQLRDSLLSLQEGLGSQLNALKNKTDSLETRSVLSSLELNHLQQRLKKAQNAPSQGFHSAPRVITQRIRSARNANKKDGDLSPWELGFTDYPYLFQQANSKLFNYLDCSDAFVEESMYCFPNGTVLSRKQLDQQALNKKLQTVQNNKTDSLDKFVYEAQGSMKSVACNDNQPCEIKTQDSVCATTDKRALNQYHFPQN